ncbi:MAG: hypothetical protein ABGY96_06145, partial [bacterium]
RRWSEELAKSLEDASLLLFLCTPHSIDSANCLDEINFALDGDKPTVSVHLQNAELTPGLKLRLSSHQAILKYELGEKEYRAKLVSGIGSYITTAPDVTLELTSADAKRQSVAKAGRGIALLALLVLVIGLFFLWSGREPGTSELSLPGKGVDQNPAQISIVVVSQPVPGFSDRAAIAVLPFINMSDDPKQDYFADGITEDLYIGLQSFQSFPIIATTSTYEYKNSTSGVRQIAETLGVGYLIKGSVRKGAERVRINVQLISHQGQQLWAEKFDFDFADTLMVQDELIQQVLLAIEPKLVITEADRARHVRTQDMEAWDYYLQAVPNVFAPFAYTNLNGEPVTEEQLQEAKKLVEKALALDPNFAAGYRLLNHIYATYAFQFRQFVTDEVASAAIKTALAYGETAQQLSPFEPSVCSCQSALLLMIGKIDTARRLQEEGIRENPSNAYVHVMMAKILQVAGENEQALVEINLGKRLSPRDLGMAQFLQYEATIHQAMGEFEKSVELSEKALLLSRSSYEASFTKILSLYAAGDVDAARDSVMKLHKDTGPGFQPVSAWAYEPFPKAVAARITLDSGEDLSVMTLNQGIKAIFDQLGWQEKDLSR